MWRFTGCATSSFYQPHSSSNSGLFENRKLFLKFQILPNEVGYQVLLTDFHENLWRETLIGQDLQDRLKSETAGLEIETGDLVNLLHQMSQNITECLCENSSDFKNLILKTSFKIGFIKLKWTFKTESCGGYAEMIKEDFLLPFFANLRDDKLIKDDFDDADLIRFYELVIPNVKRSNPVFSPLAELQSQPITHLNGTIIDEDYSNSTTQSPPIIEAVDLEEIKRKALEEHLQTSKKKKKKLI